MPASCKASKPRIVGSVLSFAIVLALAGNASAQQQAPEAQPAPPASDSASLDRVTVTGSRIARANTEGPAPVVVITAEEIERQGFTTVWESLGTLSQFTGNAQNETDVTGQSPNGQFINLRGLGPGYQLVLLNGKRIAEYPQAYGGTSTGVSTGSIPAAAVERIEVMSGGASAIYGSDAVAGVINIITKTNYEGDTVRLRGGTTSRGGGDTGLLQWVGGRSGDRWNLLYALERLDREEIVAAQRGLSYLAAPQYRTDNPRPTASLSGVYFRTTSPNVYYWPDANGNLSTSYDALLYACNQTNPNFVPFHSATTVAVPNRCGNNAYYDARTLQNGYGKTSGYLSGTFDFTPNVQGYAQFLYNRSKDKSSSQTHYFIGEAPFIVQDPVLGRVTASRSFDPAEVGQNYITFDEEAWNLNVGVQGTAFNNRFDWDASVVLSRFEIATARPRFLTNAIRDYYMGPVQGYHPDGTEIREFYIDRLFAPGTPALYDQLTTMVLNDGSSKNDGAQFVFAGPLFDLPAGSVQMAALLEASRMDYDLRPDPRITVDYTGPERVYNLTGTPGGGPRDRYAAGLEFRVPILSSVEATLAARYDEYKDVATQDAVTWQAGLEWRPTNNLLLRATHATSFRAPDILWIYAGTTGSNPFVIDEFWCRRDGVDPESDACIATGGDYYYQSYRVSSANPLLEPETGKSTTAGLVWDVVPNLSLTVDYYQIELEDRVQLSPDRITLEREADCRLGRDRAGGSVDVNSAECQFYLSTVERPITDSNPLGRITRFTSFPINAALMKTTGVDASLRYSQDIGRFGSLGVQAGYTHVFSFEHAAFADQPLRDERNNVEYNPVRNRSNLRLNWSIDDWNSSIYGYRLGSRPNNNQITHPGRGSSFTLWNADVSKRITEQMRLGLSVVNVFNKMPPQDDSYTAWPYFAPRSYSPIGRQIYANITFDF
ncbi:TonB-dependent receptor [Luteimonas aestuarii]|uniref:TonB-dependent receptor n=1 Tax=Luteimonas aestuarii TaxID=453837 RepID=A0A4R5U3R2_9GAMM|nr:TonB-dependent receptor [Luteimonas aestuarii]TDK28346.1 TonB-dependent receptor [Luteimonas aestuarii]